MSADGSTEHGVCYKDGTCSCQYGWGGPGCATELLPACAVHDRHGSSASSPGLAPSCGRLRMLSPVACECIRQCLSHGFEVCGENSAGCQFPWRSAAERSRFHHALTCVAFPAGVEPHSSMPVGGNARLTSYARYGGHGYERSSSPPIGERLAVLNRSLQEFHQQGRAFFVAEASCTRDGSQGCSARGRCLLAPSPRCVCMDGAYGASCEHVCANDCFNHCSGRGTCVHGWCRCVSGWRGADCSVATTAKPRDAPLADPSHFGQGAAHAQPHRLPPELQPHVERLRSRVYVYELPAAVNREAEAWSPRIKPLPGQPACVPVYETAMGTWGAQGSFDAFMLHDTYVRAPDGESALLYYVPLFLLQRDPYFDAHARRPMLMALRYLRARWPYWNRSKGRDHIFFIQGERQTCGGVPAEIRRSSIIIGHWGDLDCVSADKDVIAPTKTPGQNSWEEFRNRYQAVLRERLVAPLQRHGPVLFFAGSILHFGASHAHLLVDGHDTLASQEAIYQRVLHDRCAAPTTECRHAYSMGVRQAVWRQRLWAEPDMQIVSAGVRNYTAVVSSARFCMHIEGWGWGTRLTDYMALGCVPLVVNDRMLLPLANILPWGAMALRMGKREVAEIAPRLRAINTTTQRAMRLAMRQHARAFVWWRPDGLAYEYLLAALGERVHSWVQRRQPRTSRPADGTQPLDGRTWLARAAQGHCGVTQANEGDCNAGDAGNFAWSVAASTIQSAQACLTKCANCARCRVVSLSLQHQDCSWYWACESLQQMGDFKSYPRLEISESTSDEVAAAFDLP